jgi:hypothetical protein
MFLVGYADVGMSRIIRTLKYREISKPSKIALIVTLLLMVSPLFIDYKSISASIKYQDLELHVLLLSLGLMCLVPWVNMISKRKKSLKLYDDHMVFIYSDGEEETIEFSDIKGCFYNKKKKKLVLNLNDQRDLDLNIYSTARFEYIARAINQFNPRLIPDEVFSEIYESTLLLVYKKHKKGLELFLFVGNIFFAGCCEILVYIVTS